MTKTTTPTTLLIDYIRHFATAREISALAFQMETINYIDGSAMHIGKARRCLEIILEVLCQRRDLGEIELNIDTINSALTLEGMLSLVQQSKDEIDVSNMENYLLDYPDFHPSTLQNSATINKKAIVLHSFYQHCMHEKINTLFHILKPR